MVGNGAVENRRSDAQEDDKDGLHSVGRLTGRLPLPFLPLTQHALQQQLHALGDVNFLKNLRVQAQRMFINDRVTVVVNLDPECAISAIPSPPP